MTSEIKLRNLISKIVKENYDSLRAINIKARTKTRGKKDPTVLDILTDMRAISNIVTVKQIGSLMRAGPGKDDIIVNVDYLINQGFDNVKQMKGIAQKIKSINGVDLVKIVMFQNEPFFDDAGNPIVI